MEVTVAEVAVDVVVVEMEVTVAEVAVDVVVVEMEVTVVEVAGSGDVVVVGGWRWK